MSYLKKFQQDSLNALSSFLQKAAVNLDIESAYEESTRDNFGVEGAYNNAGFPNTPYVCLRLPTGGGKTLLASHTISLVCKEYLARDFSLVLWLVPSNAILEQTYICLQNKLHPYRTAIDLAFNGNVEILKIEDALNISKSSLQGNTCIIVSTLAAFRIEDIKGRKVYENNGSLKAIFDSLKPDLLDRLDKSKNGAILHSLSNVINLYNPIVIVDEAHNARTDLSFETLKRLNPACIIEYTATPKVKGKDRSNILFNVSASSLKAEDMIKLPIELLTTDIWQTSIADAVDKQKELELISLEESKQTGEYIRPIVLFQAEHDSKVHSTIDVKTVYDYLIHALKIPVNHVAIATGEERGIEGINLLEASCEIRFIITKQALKEGWDCPFAYIFSSVAEVRSSKDVEQLLGRVLRLPNVKKKQNDILNKAFAFVCSKDFVKTAKNLADSLILGCGFDSSEASKLIEPSSRQIDFGLFEKLSTEALMEIPDISTLPSELQQKIEIDKTDKKIIINQTITVKEKELIKDTVKSVSDKQKVESVFLRLNQISEESKSPQRHGVVISLPQLAIEFEDDLRIFDEEVLLPANWNLAECNQELSEEDFPVKINSGERGIIDIDSRGIPVIHSPERIQEMLNNLIISSSMNKVNLIKWLAEECRHQSIVHSKSIVFINNIIETLIQKRKLEIEHLVFMRFKLRDVIRRKIIEYHKEAKAKGYQEILFPYENTPLVKEGKGKLKLGNEFRFPDIYPVNNIYRENLRFKKHYYDLIGDLNDEEAECALQIDMNSNVETWVRNLERQESNSFWLQTSTDKFYPDFIVKLKNGVIVIVEYKGENIYDTPDSKEKRLIGAIYESVSEGKCRFVMLKGKEWTTLIKMLIL